jgi:hypothetical protein
MRLIIYFDKTEGSLDDAYFDNIDNRSSNIFEKRFLEMEKNFRDSNFIQF